MDTGVYHIYINKMHSSSKTEHFYRIFFGTYRHSAISAWQASWLSTLILALSSFPGWRLCQNVILRSEATKDPSLCTCERISLRIVGRSQSVDFGRRSPPP